MNRRERKESSFLLLAIIFLLMGLLGVAKCFVHTGLDMINLLVFPMDGFELGIGFCMSLFKLRILLIQKAGVVLAVGTCLQELPSHGVILLQFLFMLSFVLCLRLIELNFLRWYRYRWLLDGSPWRSVLSDC